MTVKRKSKVSFFFKKRISLRNRTELKKFIEGIFKRESKKLNYLNYIFCSDEELLSINKQYLKHNYFTDIITFELSEKGMAIEGEIYISVDRVKENASSLHETFNRELHRVIFHGALHLCGYGDKSAAEKGVMRKKEDFLINKNFSKMSRETISG